MINFFPLHDVHLIFSLIYVSWCDETYTKTDACNEDDFDEYFIVLCGCVDRKRCNGTNLSLALGKLINFFLRDSWKLFEMSFFMIQFDIKKVLMMKAKRKNKTFYSYHHPSLLVVVWTLSNKCVNNPLFDLFFAPFEINIYWPKACAFGYFPLSLFIDFPSPLQQPTHNRFNDD